MLPDGPGDLGVFAVRSVSLTALALLEPFGVLACPDALYLPEIFQDGLGTVHELLPHCRLNFYG